MNCSKVFLCWLGITSPVYSQQSMEMNQNVFFVSVVAKFSVTIRNAAMLVWISTCGAFKGVARLLFYSLLWMDCSFCTWECINVRLSLHCDCQRRFLQLEVRAAIQNQPQRSFTSHRAFFPPFPILSRSSVRFSSVDRTQIWTTEAPRLPSLCFSSTVTV